jgi:hypothetical protein
MALTTIIKGPLIKAANKTKPRINNNLPEIGTKHSTPKRAIKTQ